MDNACGSISRSNKKAVRDLYWYHPSNATFLQGIFFLYTAIYIILLTQPLYREYFSCALPGFRILHDERPLEVMVRPKVPIVVHEEVDDGGKQMFRKGELVLLGRGRPLEPHQALLGHGAEYGEGQGLDRLDAVSGD